jgi:hypothetical protein
MAQADGFGHRFSGRVEESANVTVTFAGHGS